MNPENRKAPKLSTLKRQNAMLKRAIKRQESVCMLKAEQRNLVTRLQDLTDFNAERISGKPEDFVQKLKDQAEKARREEQDRRGY